jgi:hypothetical protein
VTPSHTSEHQVTPELDRRRQAEIAEAEKAAKAEARKKPEPAKTPEPAKAPAKADAKPKEAKQ